jgi:elongator complex protein 3
VDPGSPRAFTLEVIRYKASGGDEVFLSYVDADDSIAGFARMRIPGEGARRKEIGSRSAIVRELKVYGRLVAVGSRPEDGWQHRGYGRKLMAEAERVAADEYGSDELVVTSAVGTREYYARMGYSRKGAYVAKDLRGRGD